MTYAITIMIISKNYCNISKYLQNLPFHFVRIKFPGIFHLLLEFCKNNHDDYLVIGDRNMPPTKSYVILTQISFVTTLVKQSP